MLYELSLFSTYFGQICVNRFNYLSSGEVSTASGSFALVQAFGLALDQTPPVTTSVIGSILAFQDDSVVYTGATCRAVYDVTDFIEPLFAVGVMVGGVSGSQSLSPATAYGFRTNRVRQDIGRGYKRFVGVTEAGVTDGGMVASGTLTQLDTAALRMSTDLSFTEGADTMSFIPVIVQKQEYAVPDTDRTAYRYYTTLAAQEAHLAEHPTWQPYSQTRTQRSRQYGHGA